MANWDKRYLDLAFFIAKWSKDPVRKVGAVLCREGVNISMGFNGFPSAIKDSPEILANKAEKRKRVIHAEVNAILKAKERPDTAYVTLLPCTQCLVLLMQAGVTRIVCPEPDYSKTSDWDVTLVLDLIDESGLDIEFLEL